MNTKISVVLSLILCTLFVTNPCYAVDSDNVLFRAMEDELQRTMGDLKMEGFDSPYYVAYTIQDIDYSAIKANFGAIVDDDTAKYRRLDIDLRVGDYSMDNSNFVSQDYNRFGFLGPDVPIEDDYDAIRHAIWLQTDSAYKSALETLAKKKATIENRMIEDRPNDFSKVEPTVRMDKPISLDENRDALKNAVQALSRLFRNYPMIQSSKVFYTGQGLNQYFVDSEGSKHIKGKVIASLFVMATTQAEDGTSLNDNLEFHFSNSADLLQAMPKIETDTKKMISDIIAQVTAEEFKSYIGPVLFIDQAAAQLFYQIVGKGVSDPVTPLYENEMFAQFMKKDDEGFLTSKIDHRILPDNFTVFDDPTVTEWQNISLIGSFQVDDQGVLAQKVDLVQEGKLKTILMNRAPTKKVSLSNGHARNVSMDQPEAHVGNLFIQAEEAVSHDQLKQQFLDLCKEMELDHGIIISRLSTTPPRDMMDGLSQMFYFFNRREEKNPLLTGPMVAYTISVADGTMKPLAPVEFSGVNYRVLRDIVGVSSDVAAYNFINYGNMGDSFSYSVVAPSVIIEEMELTSKDIKPTKKPYLSHPFFGQQ